MKLRVVELRLVYSVVQELVSVQNPYFRGVNRVVT